MATRARFLAQALAAFVYPAAAVKPPHPPHPHQTTATVGGLPLLLH